MFSFETLLVFGVLGFYLYDSSMLLYINEVVLSRGRRLWQFGCPGNNWLLLGRRLYIPNPLTPDVAIFRLYWTESNQKRQNDEESLTAFQAAIVPLQYLMMTLFIFFFVSLPLVLFLYGSGQQLLWMFGIIYVNILLILIFVFRNMGILGISNREYFVLSFESLACAPFSLNILRKITLHRSLKTDPIEFAQKMFDNETFNALVNIVSEKINEQLDFVDIDSPRYFSLKLYKTKIDGMKQ